MRNHHHQQCQNSNEAMTALSESGLKMIKIRVLVKEEHLQDRWGSRIIDASLANFFFNISLANYTHSEID